MPLIQIRGLTKLYRMGDSVVRALDGVDLNIEKGEFVAITGASGSGKSTMMHLLGCLDRPTAGSYVLRDRDVSNMSDGELADIRNKEIGFVFQTFNLINRTSALDNVGVPLFYARQGNTRGPAMKALERVGLDKRAHHKPSELSGGERQRVAIARAIVTNPAFLLADEPTGNLDSKTGDQIMEIFHSLNAQGVTIVLVTHEPDIAAQARRIVQMRDGKIVADRSRDEWLREMSAGAKPPIAVALQAQALPATETTRPDPLVTARSAHADIQPAATVQALPLEPGIASQQPAAVHRRRAPGASGALINGIIAVACYAGIIVTGFTVKAMGVPIDKMGPQNPQSQQLYLEYKTPLLVVFTLNTILFVSAIVLGILAIRFGCVSLAKIRREKGFWHGRGRAWIGLICGVVAVGLPVVTTIMGVMQAISKMTKPS